jgi:uncharacterized protein RhaS with RHS repeats
MARDYDPALGRYVESDPIGLMGGLNTYGYGYQRPTSMIDPTGEFVIVLPALPALANVGTAVVGLISGIILANALPKDPSSTDSSGDTSSGSADCPPNDPCKGLREQLRRHEKKLQDYMNDPYGSDNRGLLGQGRDQQVIDGRIRNLQRQIENFRKLLAECERRNGR